MDHKMLAKRIFSREIFLFKKFFLIAHQFYQNSSKVKIKLHEQNTGAFCIVHKIHFWNATYASFVVQIL